MAQPKTRSRPAARNGGNPVASTAKQAAASAETAARKGRLPLLAAGAAAAGLAGGVAAGSRFAGKRRGARALLRPRPRLLGIPLGPKPTVLRGVEALGRFSHNTDELREIRRQLELANRRSPLEVLLDGLTHRRGAHRAEGG